MIKTLEQFETMTDTQLSAVEGGGMGRNIATGVTTGAVLGGVPGAIAGGLVGWVLTPTIVH